MNSSSRKRPRYDNSSSNMSSTSWSVESGLGLDALFGGDIGKQQQQRGGKVILFDSKREAVEQPCKQKTNPAACIKTNSNNVQRQKNKNESFFTFRMEHREGGPMAQHYGEERILLFRSDQAGAIAKIIFSSTPAEDLDDNNNGTLSMKGKSDEEKPEEQQEQDELERMAQAKVHVLSVKEQYRGYNLGGLLFSKAMSVLRQRYHEDYGNYEKDGGSVTSTNPCWKRSLEDDSQNIRCQLDAEEDIRRYNKLVGFYEQLGCHVKPKAKITYINNNDGETYRKVPMQIALRSRDVPRTKPRDSTSNTPQSMNKFLPVMLLEAPGKRVEILHQHPRNRLDWLLAENRNGDLEFRTTSGLLLFADASGECHLLDDTRSCTEEINSVFHLSRFSGTCQSNRIMENDDDDDDDRVCEAYYHKDLWLVKTAYGSYLAVNPTSHLLSCSKDPTFWEANGHNFTLVCTSDTPSRRHHYRKMWSIQTAAYNQSMREHYLRFSTAKMTFKRALDLVKDSPADPFTMKINGQVPSLRGLMFRTAEAARAAGHPDWVQLIALVHGLASALNYVEDRFAVRLKYSGYDWTVVSHSWIVGCRAPDGIEYEEFRSLNVDEQDERFSTPNGMYQTGCGLDNVTLTWTGTEYMHFMLKHNNIDIPDEGLSVLRYSSLFPWHTQNKYTLFATPEDDDIQTFAADFDDMLNDAKRCHLHSIDFDDEYCDILWSTHYSHIARKYCADGILSW